MATTAGIRRALAPRLTATTSLLSRKPQLKVYLFRPQRSLSTSSTVLHENPLVTKPFGEPIDSHPLRSKVCYTQTNMSVMCAGDSTETANTWTRSSSRACAFDPKNAAWIASEDAHQGREAHHCRCVWEGRCREIHYSRYFFVYTETSRVT